MECLCTFLPGEAGEVPRRGGGVMGRADTVADDPSVAGDRATSPRKRKEEYDQLLRSALVVLSVTKDLTPATRPVSDRSARSFAALRTTRMLVLLV